MARTKVKPNSTHRRNSSASGRAATDPRTRLLEVAIQLFARYGYDPVSTGAVAKASGLTQSMVHYHFGSKEKLWKAAIQKLMRDRGAIFPIGKMDLQDLEPSARLKVIVRTYVHASAADPDLARIMMHEGMIQGPRLKWLVEEYVLTAFRAFESAITDAIAVGAVRKIPVRDLTSIIVAVGMPLSLGALLQQIYGINILDKAHVDSLTDSIITVLFQGMENPPQKAAPGRQAGPTKTVQ